MQIQFGAMAASGQAMALSKARKVGLAEGRRIGRKKAAPTPTLLSAREEVLRGFKRENLIWAAVVASASALIVLSLIG